MQNPTLSPCSPLWNDTIMWQSSYESFFMVFRFSVNMFAFQSYYALSPSHHVLSFAASRQWTCAQHHVAHALHPAHIPKIFLMTQVHTQLTLVRVLNVQVKDFSSLPSWKWGKPKDEMKKILFFFFFVFAKWISEGILWNNFFPIG